MNFIYVLIPEEIIKAIGWTIFHSIWQGAVISILLAGVLLMTGKKSAQLRYILSVTALFFMFGISVITFTQVYSANTSLARAIYLAECHSQPGRVKRMTYRKITVRRPCSRTRCSACQRTARASATRSASRPIAARSSGESECSTRATSCSMIGPSSRSAVT